MSGVGGFDDFGDNALLGTDVNASYNGTQANFKDSQANFKSEIGTSATKAGTSETNIGIIETEAGNKLTEVSKEPPSKQAVELPKITEAILEQVHISGEQTKMCRDLDLVQVVVQETAKKSDIIQKKAEALVNEGLLENTRFDKDEISKAMKSPFENNQTEYKKNVRAIKGHKEEVIVIEKRFDEISRKLTRYVIIENNQFIPVDPKNPLHAKYFEKENFTLGILEKDELLCDFSSKEAFKALSDQLNGRKIKCLPRKDYEKKQARGKKLFDEYKILSIVRQIKLKEIQELENRQTLLLFVMRQQILMMQPNSQENGDIGLNAKLNQRLAIVINLNTRTIKKVHSVELTEMNEKLNHKLLNRGKLSQYERTILTILVSERRRQQKRIEEEKRKEKADADKQDERKADLTEDNKKFDLEVTRVKKQAIEKQITAFQNFDWPAPEIVEDFIIHLQGVEIPLEILAEDSLIAILQDFLQPEEVYISFNIDEVAKSSLDTGEISHINLPLAEMQGVIGILQIEQNPYVMEKLVYEAQKIGRIRIYKPYRQPNIII